MTWWDTFKEWFLSLGDKYHVNPYIFGGIYIGAIPLFFLCRSDTAFFLVLKLDHSKS